MLWTLASAFFLWLAWRELRSPYTPGGGERFWPYQIGVLVLAALCAWPPVSTWMFERRLQRLVSTLADGRPSKVHCNTFFDTMLDPHAMSAGHARPDTGEVVLQKPWCSHLRRYLSAPANAGETEIQALNLITHEAMHVRGEMDEAVAECQAIQRNARAAELLGVPAYIAAHSAQRFYDEIYPRIAQSQAFGYYHTTACTKGGALDEGLAGAPW